MTKIIKLEGRTRKGKNRISENSEFWEILKKSDNVPCLNNKDGLLICSCKNPIHIRWICEQNDLDFKIIENNT